MALDFGAGCVGGIAGVIVGHPFDTVKVRLQTQDCKNIRYTGTINCLMTTVRNESVFGLYKGMSSPLAGIAFVNAIVFGVYGNVQRLQKDPNNLVSVACAGSMAGLVQSIISSPTELIKLRMQLQEDNVRPPPKGFNTQNLQLSKQTDVLAKYRSPVDCMLKIHRSEGFRGLYRGFGITVCREIPGFGIYFASYEAMMKLCSSSNSKNNNLVIMMAGGMSGIFSWVFTYPLDVVKSRVQADCSGRYRGALHCFLLSYHTDGLPSFFRGLSSTIIRAFPTNAAVFFAVSWTFRMFGMQKVNTG